MLSARSEEYDKLFGFELGIDDYVAVSYTHLYVAAFVRGDRELNMTKLVNALDIPEHAIEFADEDKMSAATGCVGGFTGPVGLHDCKIVVDSELPGLKNLCAGACKERCV